MSDAALPGGAQEDRHAHGHQRGGHTYPGHELCLELYHPWNANWYTDNRLSCWYPELGAVAGYAVTCVYGVADPAYSALTLMDVLEAADRVGRLLEARGFEEVRAIMGTHQYVKR